MQKVGMNRRGAQGAGSVYQREEDGLWVAKLPVKIEGKTKPLVQYASSKKEANKLLEAMKLKRSEHSLIPADKITFGEWLHQWLVMYKKPKLKPRTYQSYEYQIGIIEPLWDIPLQGLDTDTLQSFFNKLLARLSRSTVFKLYVIIRQALNKAVKTRKIKENPADGCEVKMAKNIVNNILSAPQVVILFNAAAGKRRRRIRAIIKTAVYTGARQGEILALKWNDIDFKNKKVRIDQNLSCIQGDRLLLTVKNEKPRTVTAHEDLFTELAEYKELSPFKGDDDLVFCTKNGDPILTRNVARDWYAVKEDAGLTCRFHDLRHTCASHLFNIAGADTRSIGEQLGHIDPRSTDRYVHPESEKNRPFTKKVGDAYKFPASPKKKK